MKPMLPAMLLLLVPLSACGSAEDEPRPVDSEVAIEGPGDTDGLQPGDQSLADPAPGSVTAPQQGATAGEPVAVETIPAAAHGRWGLVPADCTRPAGEAKGLMTVDANSVRFYESVGTLDDVKERSDSGIRAAFAFEGEGMEWRRDMTLNVAGDTLVRREYGNEALEGPLRYMRCEA